MKKYSQRGFTLIELLVVIAIIGILSSVVLASLSTARGKGKDSAVQAQMASTRAQAELFAQGNSGSFSGVCAALGNATNPGILSLLNGAATSGGKTATPVTTVGTAGAYNVTTCHDSASAWAAESPLSASISGTPSMWCVDSTGKSVKETVNLAATTGLSCQ